MGDGPPQTRKSEGERGERERERERKRRKDLKYFSFDSVSQMY